MRLQAFTDLALRLVVRLAVENDTFTPVSVLADQLNVSSAHAAKVAGSLEKFGTVQTRRGRNGGIRLAPHGRETSIGALVRHLEGSAEVVECEGTHPCPLRSACALRAALARAQEAFFAALDPLTVADVVTPRTRQLLLSITAAAS